MSFQSKFIAAASAAALTLIAGTVSAATIFEDNFNRSNSNTVGNGWNELEWNSNDVAINNNSLMLRDYLGGEPDAAASSLVIDASGYENISVEFKWRSLSPNENNDDLYLSWALDPAPAITDENAWTQVFQGNDGGTNWFTANVALAGAENGMFNLMLWTDVGSYNEGYLIDYVTVTGDAISAVPLPAGMPLLLGGIAAFALARRKRAQA
ncbi:VPLPA-CTERM sorting domain-containing protein [Sedimentitalea nanhaiensis]|uniref:VPLPA-CTERM protein sorting domain-containing protein n=1 Tax=Sedimentitalea nanhaiensis TaxID=999627 RepID=A0A1I6Y4T0_9RHOB|nr:VPLPA-CTERM sorting domain-containing protein [Sedimentitalea nanhaiensis]SFT45508.1 VPLPA-CTERM protein sorting domain-containing protein [Sedimentitalea nanhaiensis]